jgi:hypothetical protein
MSNKLKNPHSRRRLGGSVNRLSIYDGETAVGSVVPTDDGRFQTYDADGYPAGIFDTLRDAARSLPKAEVTS